MTTVEAIHGCNEAQRVFDTAYRAWKKESTDDRLCDMIDGLTGMLNAGCDLMDSPASEEIKLAYNRFLGSAKRLVSTARPVHERIAITRYN